MDERYIDRARETGNAAARRLAETAQETAERAGSYMQSQMNNVSERAQEFAQRADARVAELTGRPVESWASDVRTYVRANPLVALGVAIGLGYVIGKLLVRNDA